MYQLFKKEQDQYGTLAQSTQSDLHFLHKQARTSIAEISLFLSTYTLLKKEYMNTLLSR